MGSVLQGGRRRRRWQAGLVRLAVLLLLLGLAVATWLLLADERDERRPAAPVVAAGAAKASLPPPPPRLERPASPELSLDRADAFRVRLRRPPRAGLVFDLGSGAVLWRRAPLRRLPIASLTKIMTALLVTERAAPGERVRIARNLRYSGSALGVLPRGRRVPLEPLLNGLIIVSGNDAAIALAQHAAGSERRFVRLMNARARELGLRCTRFVSSHGLEGGNRSCARDLAVLATLAMRSRRIARVAAKRGATLRFPIKGGRLFLTGHNPLMRTDYRGAVGLKTGYTSDAGRCFVGVARRGGRTLGVVLLDAPLLPRHARLLLDRGFRSG